MTDIEKFQRGEITLEQYLKSNELPERCRQAWDKYEELRRQREGKSKPEDSFTMFLAEGLCGQMVNIETGETMTMSPADVERVMQQPATLVEDLSFEELQQIYANEQWY